MGKSMTKPEVYDSVKKWLSKLQIKSRSLDFSKSSTKRSALYWLKRFVKWRGTDPDSLIDQRKRQLESKSEAVRLEHEEYVEDFIVKLQNDGYAPNSIATATGLIRSFYKANRVPLKEIATVAIRRVRFFKVPRLPELKKMCNVADIHIRTWILCQKDSGLGNIDLLSLTLTNLSSEFGTIRMQLKKGIEPIHVEIRRQKTGERTDTFFGPNAIEGLNEYVNLKNRGRIFKMSVRSIQQKVKAAAIRAKVATKDRPITPYSLRKFFNTRMKAAGVNEAIVERWMGHSIGRVRGAYLAVGRDETFSGMPISKLAEIYMEAYRDEKFGIDLGMV